MLRLLNRHVVPPHGHLRADSQPPTGATTPPSAASTPAERLHAEAVARLHPYCGGLSPDAFEALVRQVVAFRTRWGPTPNGRGGAR